MQAFNDDGSINEDFVRATYVRAPMPRHIGMPSEEMMERCRVSYERQLAKRERQLAILAEDVAALFGHPDTITDADMRIAKGIFRKGYRRLQQPETPIDKVTSSNQSL